MKDLANDAAVVERKSIGFWIYLMTDVLLFASLFATFAVLRTSTYGGPSGAAIFDLPFVLVETLALLTSSFSVGLAVLAAQRGYKKQTMIWLGITFLLGILFLVLELTEFSHLAAEGYNWQRSAFLSAFFTLVGTHGLHITVGLLWMLVMMIRLWRFNLKKSDLNRLALLGLFWHFLDVIWIFIFSVVYLIGSMS